MSVHYNVNLHLNDNSLCPTIIQAQVHESISIFIDVNDLNVTDTSKLFPINFCGLIKNKLGNFKVECGVESSDANVDTGEVYYNTVTKQIIIRCNDITKMKGDMICELYFYNGYTDNNTYLITNPFIIEIAETAMDTPGDEMPDLDATYAEMKQMLKDYNDGKLGGMTEEEKEDFSNMKTSITSLTNKLNSHTVNADMAFSDIRAVQDKNTQKIEILESSVNALGTSNVDGLMYENEYLYLTANNEVVGDGVHIISGSGGGGGGTSGNNAILTLSRTTDWMTTSVAKGEDCNITFLWSSVENGISTGNGSLFLYVNGSLKLTKEVAQGNITQNVKDYLTTGSNTVKVQIRDVYDNTRSINYMISVIELIIESSFDSSQVYMGDIRFPFKAYGDLEKTVHFELDDTELDTLTVTTSGRQTTYTIPEQSAGSHSLKIWFTCTINEQDVRSNTLYFDIMCITSSSSNTVISSSFTETEINQYETISIKYYVYNPNNLYSDVDLYENGSKIASLTDVDRTEQTWTYTAKTAGALTLKISSGGTVKEFNITVNESGVNVTPATDSLMLYLSSAGRSNNESNKSVWSYNNISCEFSNFNFVSDGWIIDNDGLVALRLRENAKLTIPYKPFTSDCKNTGKTIELEFAARSVLDYDTTIISCMDSNGRGFKVTPQKASIHGLLKGTESMYKEDEHVRISFVIEKSSEADKLIKCYINGVMCNPIVYDASEDFSQPVPLDIIIGSDQCITDIYCIRIYDNALTRFEILDNWIYDTQDGQLKTDRYLRNQVFDAYGKVTIDKLPTYLPYMVFKNAYSSSDPSIAVPGLPQSKDDKTYVCDGYYVDKINPNKSFSWKLASLKIQGTSSAGYPRKNYKIKFSKGITLTDGTTSKKYALRDGMIEEKTFCLKADVASSEGCNNVELVRLYNDTCTYKTPYQQADSRCRQGIDGFPMVIFYDDGNTVEFMGKYNFNLDKSNNDTYGFSEGDESWETLNNTSARSLYKSDDFTSTSTDEEGNVIKAWMGDFESRYPEEYEDGSIYDDGTKLQAWISWVKSTDPEQATNDTLMTSVTLYSPTQLKNVTYTTDSADYRLAKFRAELPDHGNVDDLVFYYLFTELFLMIDSRAKNAFPTIINSEGKWLMFPYDFDTAIGINNEGALVFSPYLEDVDTLSGSMVFNGQTSVLWCNLRKCFFPEMKAMYATLRSNGSWSYEKVEKAFSEHQAKWGEAIFNEDSFFKYIIPLEEGNGSYLMMAQGDKAQQRKWWLYHRFKYIDSKYIAGDSAKDLFTIRAYNKANFKITPFHDMYIDVRYASNLVQVRGKADKESELICPVTSLNDSECYIYNISQVKALGDLSGFKVGLIDLTNAVKLTELQIGSSASGYSNPNLTELSFATNEMMLRSVDVRNCPNLTGSLDMSSCHFLEEVYFGGTAVTGITLPNTSTVKILDLPSTITNLTLINQQSITTLNLSSYSQLGSVRIEHPSAYVNSKIPEIIKGMTSNNRIRLIDFSISMTTLAEVKEFTDKIKTFKGIDENGNNIDTPQLAGTIKISGKAYWSQLNALQAGNPNLTITCDHIIKVIKFYSGDTVIYTEELDNNQECVDPLEEGLIDTPTKTSDGYNSYSYSGWDKTPTGIFATDADIHAQFTATKLWYTVRFYNGSSLLKTYNVGYKEKVTYDGPAPTKAADNYNTYTFKGWDYDLTTPITAHTDIHAEFTATKILYTVKFYNEGTLLETKQVGYNEKVTYTGATPVKERDAQYSYEFSGWDYDIVNTPITKATNINAKFTATTRKYVVKFYNDTTLLETYNIEYGKKVTYNGATPTKSDVYKIYTFTGWDFDIVNTPITGDTDIYAQYSETTRYYTVKFYNELEVVETKSVTYGSKVTYTGDTPVKPATVYYTYTFSGWDRDLNIGITENTDIHAQFSAAKVYYTVKFYNDTTLLETKQVGYGEKVTYTGATPTKEKTAAYTYVFKGWDYDIVNNTITTSKDIHAQFTQNDRYYTVKFYNEGSLLATKSVKYNTKVTYDGETPTKASTESTTYTFSGWDFNIANNNITSDKNINAQFTALVKTFTVKFYNGSTLLQTSTVEYGKTAIYNGDTPSSSSGSFLGWSPSLDTIIKADTNFYAQFGTKITRNILNQYAPVSTTTVIKFVTEPPTGDGWTTTILNDNCNVYAKDTEVWFVSDTPILGGQSVSTNGYFDSRKALITLDLSNFNTSACTSMRYMFYNCSKLTVLDLSNFDTSACYDMGCMFSGCSSLTTLNTSSFDTSKCINMGYMFHNCSKLTTLDLSNFNTSACTDMSSTFYGCSSLTSLDLSSFDTSACTSMEYMFYNCSKLTVLDLSSFDTSACTDMSSTFYGCSSLTSLDLSSFDTSACTNMSSTFYGCSSLTSLDLSSFDTSKCTKINSMFYGCSSLTSLDLSSFDTSACTNMSSTFYGCSSLTSIDLSSFDISNCSGIDSMFYACRSLTSLDLGNFNTSACTTTAMIFSGCSKLVTVKIHSATPPTLTVSILFPSSNTGFLIHIPVGSLSAYQTATNWSTYAGYYVEDSAVTPL